MPTLLCFKSRRDGKGHATTEIPDQTQNHRTVSTKWKFLSHRSTALKTNQKPRVSNHQTHLNLINALQLPPTNAQIAALARLQTLFALPKHRTTFSTFSSIITDLDTVLFSNLLSPHTICQAAWAQGRVEHRRDRTSTCVSDGAQTRTPRTGRITVGYSASSIPSTGSATSPPETFARIRDSISVAIAGFWRRKSFAASRPWPRRCEL